MSLEQNNLPDLEQGNPPSSLEMTTAAASPCADDNQNDNRIPSLEQQEGGKNENTTPTIEHGSAETLESPPDNNANQHHHPPDPAIDHLGKHRQYWRDMILGVNDGLVSTFLLVSGVVGSGLAPTDILLTAIAGALAGAVSMASGEFIATKSQNEVLEGEIGLEKVHIRDNNANEIQEIGGLLEIIGIPQESLEIRKGLVTLYENNPDSLLKLMVALEFGVVEEERRSPICAAAMSGLLFFVGCLPSVLPFAATGLSTKQALVIACAATVTALLIVGMVKTWASRGNCFTAAVENLFVAGVGGVLAYYVGVFFETILR